MADLEGNAPHHAAAWGWRLKRLGDRDEWQAGGDCVGWVEGEDLYLEPMSAYAAAQRLAGIAGGSVPVQPQTLWKRLHQAGHLQTIDEARGRLKIRKVVVGKRREVLHFTISALLENPSHSSH